jgi:hypothetical protein
MIRQLISELQLLRLTIGRMDKTMSTVPTGLAALTQAATDIATAINGAVVAINKAAADLQGSDSSEDATVAATAASLETLADNLTSAVAPLNAIVAPPAIS